MGEKGDSRLVNSALLLIMALVGLGYAFLGGVILIGEGIYWLSGERK